MDDFERIIVSGEPQGRIDEGVILNTIVGDSVSFETEGWTKKTRSSAEMERLRRDGSEAEMEGGIVVRRDLKQHIARMV